MTDEFEVEQVLKASESFSDGNDASRFLRDKAASDPRFEQLSPNEFKFKDYYFRVGLYFFHLQYIKNLETLNEIPFLREDPIAPELIACRLLGEEQRDFLLTVRIRGAEQGNVVPLDQGLPSVPAAEKDRVLRLIGIMLGKGYYFQDMTQRNAWFVVPSTGKLVLGRHLSLKAVPDETHREEALKRIKEIFSY